MRFRSMIVLVAMSLFLAAHGAPAIDLLYARSYSLGSSDNPSRSSSEPNAGDGPDVAHTVSKSKDEILFDGIPFDEIQEAGKLRGKFPSTSLRKSPLGVQKPVAAGTLAATTTMNAEGKMTNTQHPTTPQPPGTVGTHLPAARGKAADPHHLPGSQPHPASPGTPSHAGLETPQTEGKTPDPHPNSQLSPGSEKKLEGAEAKAADAHHAAGSQPLAGETKLETPHPGTAPTPEHPDASKPQTEEERKKKEEEEKKEKEQKEQKEKEEEEEKKKKKEQEEEGQRGQRMGDYPGNPYGQEQGYGQNDYDEYGSRPPSRLEQATALTTAATQVISTGAEVVRTFKGNSGTNGMNGMNGMGGMDVWEEGEEWEEWEEWEEIQWEETVAQQAWDSKLVFPIVVRTSSSSATIQIDPKKMF
ncbi:hypothetical protein C8R42DRAFT_649063 [Lentinula raphanica]|nr:hypothetical protein C8R42DRAFT_649063 [Lentinula raphanica]